MPEPNNTLDTQTGKRQVVLVLFQWPSNFSGGFNEACYAVSTGDVLEVLGRRWQAVPEIDIKMRNQHGGTKDHPIVMRMPKHRPLDEMIRAAAFPKVTVTIYELNLDDDTSARELFQGTVLKITSDPFKRAATVRVDVASHKHKLGVSLGIVTQKGCAWNFGDKGCGVFLPPLQELATVIAIDRNTLTLQGLATTGVFQYWFRGYVEFGGLRLMVRAYETGNQVSLSELPPADWLNKRVRLTPGCDKTIQTCRNRWNNEERMIPLGHKMPAYHPLIESP